MDMKLEVVVLPVSDVDRARQFYEKLKFRLDADFTVKPGYRIVQLTPPGSPCSIIFGEGVTDAAPGSTQGLQLVVSDIEAARAELMAAGAAPSDVFHDETGIFHHAGTAGRVAGPAPERQSYGSFVSFSDPDGNGWIVQEITQRLPGRVEDAQAAERLLTDLLKKAAAAHGVYEKAALGGVYDSDWPAWYARHMAAALAETGLHLVKDAK